VSKVDLNRFSKHIERLELANRAASTEAVSVSPRHPFPQPVHVLYGGAHLFSEKTFEKIASLAKDAFKYAVPNAAALNSRCGESWTHAFSSDVFRRVESKIMSHPLEDYRIDFEDGYGVRSDDEEDGHAISAARVLLSSIHGQYAPKNIGIRIKPLSSGSMRRSLKTLTLFLESFDQSRQQQLTAPKHLIVTLPKVTNAEQVATLVEILETYEKDLHLSQGFFSIELIIESPDAFLGRDGSIPLASFIHSAAGRCRGLHFGVYDFTSSLGIGSAGQSIDHLACDFARIWIQIGAALAPHMAVSDGIISSLPILPKESTDESKRQFDATWLYNYQQMMRSLSNGYYQGWDLHPCQLPIRHIANHVFILREFEGAVTRLNTFLAKSAQASHVGGMFDDRASVLGLLNFFDRAISSAVVSQSDLKKAGVDLDVARSAI
jgi:citrate lyase beta subunit